MADFSDQATDGAVSAMPVQRCKGDENVVTGCADRFRSPTPSMDLGVVRGQIGALAACSGLRRLGERFATYEDSSILRRLLSQIKPAAQRLGRRAGRAWS
jgi:hypothetical protein